MRPSFAVAVAYKWRLRRPAITVIKHTKGWSAYSHFRQHGKTPTEELPACDNLDCDCFEELGPTGKAFMTLCYSYCCGRLSLLPVPV